ncbi:MAG: hypothetical protein KatS3mg057_2612 [Herpetosiphonaceae bacterium]|nr:MAG: hypothetical protein KatS3mg057_2612 [Herpetosiphonaceae bacterium]
MGVAAGNGCSLALSCDLVLAAAGASFVLSFVRLGLVPDAGATWLLPRLIGERRAKELVMTARRLDAAEALEWGLISRVVPDDALAGEALELACRLATGPALALGLGKRLVADAPAAHVRRSAGGRIAGPGTLRRLSGLPRGCRCFPGEARAELLTLSWHELYLNVENCL